MFDFNADNATIARATVASAIGFRPLTAAGRTRGLRPIGRSFAFVPCPQTQATVTGSIWSSTGTRVDSADAMGIATDLAKPARHLRPRNIRST